MLPPEDRSQTLSQDLMQQREHVRIGWLVVVRVTRARRAAIVHEQPVELDVSSERFVCQPVVSAGEQNGIAIKRQPACNRVDGGPDDDQGDEDALPGRPGFFVLWESAGVSEARDLPPRAPHLSPPPRGEGPWSGKGARG